MPRDPAALYQALRAQRRELTQQLDELETARQSLTMQLQRAPTGIQRQGLETPVMDLDARISAVDKAIAGSQVEMSKVAGIPGAVVEEPREIPQGPPEGVFILGTVFMLVVLLPLSIAYARRIWKRGAVAVSSIPRELMDRLGRIEQASEVTALEVERIGEGQRFLTRLLTERENVRVGNAESHRLLPEQPGTR
ncbi:MAG TPA: hypothetical protein VNJ04_12565 [Gemmatimonadaceae bacterium]|nr:hypothetical protein [Gemmatimonadaceae bacterium]